VPEEPFPVCGTALASSRLGAFFPFDSLPCRPSHGHGYSEEPAPANLIGIDKLVIRFLVFPAHRGAASKAARL
jgi:hypothetical protein